MGVTLIWVLLLNGHNTTIGFIFLRTPLYRCTIQTRDARHFSRRNRDALSPGKDVGQLSERPGPGAVVGGVGMLGRGREVYFGKSARGRHWVISVQCKIVTTKRRSDTDN